MTEKIKFGYMNCEGCGSGGIKTRCLVRQNSATGTLSHVCDECDKTYYAKPAEKALHARWLKNIERTAPAAAPAAAAPAAAKPAEEKKPAPAEDKKPAPARSPFRMPGT